MEHWSKNFHESINDNFLKHKAKGILIGKIMES